MVHGRRRLTAVFALSVVVAAACGDTSSDDGYDVASQTVSDETTQSISVFAPDADGSWPVVLVYHGNEGKREDMALLGERVAAAGAVVFAPDYRSGDFSEHGLIETVTDVECAYRYVRSIAADLGGDLHRPVVWVGWSLGAVWAVQGGLDETIDDTGTILTCTPEVPRPDVIIAIAGCYEEVGQGFDPEQWGNPDARLVLVAGADDTVCPAAESRRVTEELRSRDYDVRLVTLDGADHFAPVFHAYENGDMVEAPDSPAGAEVLQLITDALAEPGTRGG
jgi:dienelactone hydrolase